jgi:YfiH family protein
MNQKMKSRQPVYHTFQILSQVPDLIHGFFTRHGGVSEPPYDTLNVVWSNGDSKDAVRENLHRIKDVLQLDRLVEAPQVHGDTIHVVDETMLAQADGHPTVRFNSPGDALVTCLRGVGLLIKVADCQAVFLVDPVQKVIANVHCGWRGSVVTILPKVVRFLKDRFGTCPEDLMATIGPSLGPCCGEFRNYHHELPPSFWSFQMKPRYFNFWAISRRQLLDAGLHSEHIEVTGRCTVCETLDFFSYRGESVTGRMAAVVGWNQ